MKYLFSLLSLVLFYKAQAQITSVSTGANEKYIEVKATDTLMINPDDIALKIALHKSEASGYFSDGGDNEDEERKRKGEITVLKYKIEEFLQKNKYSFTFHDEKKEKDYFSKDLNVYENAFEVHVKKVEDVNKIKKELSTYNNISVSVTDTKIDNKEKYELLAIEKVMKKAEREAQAIAKAMNMVLDKPINVNNQSATDMYSSMFNNPESMGGFGALFSMMGNLFKGATQQNPQVIVSKTLVVRYSIK